MRLTLLTFAVAVFASSPGLAEETPHKIGISPIVEENEDDGNADGKYDSSAYDLTYTYSYTNTYSQSDNRDIDIPSPDTDEGYTSTAGEEYSSTKMDEYSSTTLGEDYTSTAGEEYSSTKTEEYSSTSDEEYSSTPGEDYSSTEEEEYTSSEKEDYSSPEKEYSSPELDYSYVSTTYTDTAYSSYGSGVGLPQECVPGCNVHKLHNSICDPECDNEPCQFDGGDCAAAQRGTFRFALGQFNETVHGSSEFKAFMISAIAQGLEVDESLVEILFVWEGSVVVGFMVKSSDPIPSNAANRVKPYAEDLEDRFHLGGFLEYSPTLPPTPTPTAKPTAAPTVHVTKFRPTDPTSAPTASAKPVKPPMEEEPTRSPTRRPPTNAPTSTPTELDGSLRGTNDEPANEPAGGDNSNLGVIIGAAAGGVVVLATVVFLLVKKPACCCGSRTEGNGGSSSSSAEHLTGTGQDEVAKPMERNASGESTDVDSDDENEDVHGEAVVVEC